MASSTTVIGSGPTRPENAWDNHKDASQVPSPRPRKPHYNHIHRFPVPLRVHPLPPLIPHNPLSVISIALSYLTFFISPPQQETYLAYFDSLTSSVHVTDPQAIRALWEMGFFGKGSLSRSEPTWLEREKKRRGLIGADTSEEVTRKRRMERREWKLERARKEKEAITLRLKAEAESKAPPIARNIVDNENNTTNGTLTSAHADGIRTPRHSPSSSLKQEPVNRDIDTRRANGVKTVRFSPTVEENKYDEGLNSDPQLQDSKM